MRSERQLCREGPGAQAAGPPAAGRGRGSGQEHLVGPTCPDGSWRLAEDEKRLYRKPVSGAGPGPAGVPAAAPPRVEMNEGSLNSPSCSAHTPGWELWAPERHTHAVSAVNGLRRQRGQRAWGQVGGTCAPEPGRPADSDRLGLLPWEELSIAGVDTAGPESTAKVGIRSQAYGRCWAPAPNGDSSSLPVARAEPQG